jgi:predicted polyphosphate/ATP-dependent NAD kinase
MMSGRKLRIGLIINPLAGIGGAVGLKGSDGDETVAKALALGALPQAGERVAQVFALLNGMSEQADWYTYPGAMGQQVLERAGIACKVVGALSGERTQASDTQQAAHLLKDAQVDLLIFAGGDGTARDVFDVVGTRQLCLGIPAGVKIHSGVYATSLQGAARLLQKLLHHVPVMANLAQIRDIDESALRAGRVQARWYGELLVPTDESTMQQVKASAPDTDPVVLLDIAAAIASQLEPDTFYLIGPGTTTQALMAHLGLPNTLLGVDLICNGELIANDINEQQILDRVGNAPCGIVITPIGGQGHLFGRGNHQLSPAVIRHCRRDRILVLATPGKLAGLNGRPLLVDTPDPELNQALCGVQTVVTGYDQRVIWPVAW